jgi:hypothetical protein
MSEAFEAACEVLHDAGPPEVVREIIAGRIIAAARFGERDPAHLRLAALAGHQIGWSVSVQQLFDLLRLESTNRVCGILHGISALGALSVGKPKFE